MKFKGSIVSAKASINASGDITRRVTLDLHGDDFPALDALLKKPLDIEIKEEKNSGPFEE